mmetsp:Transcript_12340/g.10643  ORF Transcript_12340/g.10643 Transcript_12340/m.10643 type:complete len:135 (+) Transcript_12340:536-940(+)
MEVGSQLVHFINELYELYPSLTLQELYIFGESYGGHYIPAMATRLTQAGIKVSGVGIGDGWISPKAQVHSWSSYAYSAGVIDQKQYDTVFNLETEFINKIDAGQYDQALDTFNNFRSIASQYIPDISNVRNFSS